MPSQDLQVLTADELAKILRISPWTVRRWEAQGRIPRYNVGGRVLRFNLPDVLAAIEGQKNIC
jgi:excisionase family DNA binding protein